MARGNRGRTIDVKFWTNFSPVSVESATAQVNGGARIDIASPSTILRIRGSWWAMFNETVQVDDQMTITVGIGVATTDAATVGGASLPSPASDIDFPWLYWDQVTLQSLVAAAPTAWGTAMQQRTVDSKSMRKLRPNQSLVWVSEYTSPSGAPVTLFFSPAMRVLIGSG